MTNAELDAQEAADSRAARDQIDQAAEELLHEVAYGFRSLGGWTDVRKAGEGARALLLRYEVNPLHRSRPLSDAAFELALGDLARPSTASLGWQAFAAIQEKATGFLISRMGSSGSPPQSTDDAIDWEAVSRAAVEAAEAEVEAQMIRAKEPETAPKRFDALGQRVTGCCGDYSTYDEFAVLYCKGCYCQVEEGEGDGTEFLPGVTADAYFSARFKEGT